MHYDVGIDLAWGARAQTGLAVLDDAGRLLDVGTVRTDTEILDWLGPWTAGPCLVAIDAPIVVENASGARICERLVASHFGRFGIACHPTNRSNPAFADGGRARRIADALGLEYRLTSGHRRAAEVYPHVAIVVLFDLPHVLRYKNKPGRDLTLLREQTLRLLDHLDGLEQTEIPLVTSGSEPWRTIRSTVDTARTKAALRRVEDAVDAVVCTYVARYSRLRPDAVRYLGPAEEGSILVPVTGPADARSTP